MASGQAINARKRRGTSATAVSNNSVKKWLKTRRVSPGDIVMFRTNNIHMLGASGTVIGYMSKHEVLIRTFGGSDTDYPPVFISVYDREPNPHHQGSKNPNRSGCTLASYSNYIQKVVYRNSPKPAKKRRPVKMLPVTRDELPAVLTGAVDVDGHHVVLTETTPAVPEQQQP